MNTKPTEDITVIISKFVSEDCWHMVLNKDMKTYNENYFDSNALGLSGYFKYEE